MRTLQRNEIKRLVTRMKKRLIHEKMVRTELRIVSKRNLKEYRLLFWRKHSDDLGGFYLASAEKIFRLHDVLLYYLLKNIRKGNYLVPHG